MSNTKTRNKLNLRDFKGFLFNRIAASGWLNAIAYSETPEDGITLIVYDKGRIVRKAKLGNIGVYSDLLARVKADTDKDTLSNIINYIDLYY